MCGAAPIKLLEGRLHFSLCLALSYNQLSLDISHPPDLIKGVNIIHAHYELIRMSPKSLIRPISSCPQPSRGLALENRVGHRRFIWTNGPIHLESNYHANCQSSLPASSGLMVGYRNCVPVHCEMSAALDDERTVCDSVRPNHSHLAIEGDTRCDDPTRL